MIQIEDLTVRYRARHALAGVTARFDVGVNGLLGPNGAGKSTLVRVLATLITPTSGSAEVLGRRLDAASDPREIRRRLGYLPQELGYYPRFTAREFVEHFAWLKEVPAAGLPDAVPRALERVGLADRADEKIRRLSGGMRRRVGIAQAIVGEPPVLLLDEPATGLDPEQRMEFRQLLAELGRQSCVIVSSHLVEDVAKACDRMWVLDAGRPVFEGTPAELAADGDLEAGYRAVLSSAREEAA
ncbi:ABC-2 type transport system ATP-binding protein [Saccharopolyspora erythraea NRRL 2338]|uniref:ABC transporter ATP-binding protein n=2 Tax=Saccharopolyspora erythraea TaxID=1836 RepID=A4F618_SACEN|nr:ABC transporter ATP-binding protein [Saccharopolyspora erythraea]EQD83775.1 daunorubicin ABC transporter ATPase [Saccharopolyspora erythraea D]PFG93291.1 ABC-2 type transport system ATP-binding protein [Saccharopolyspora erythraea NRRL 2338]QRK90137.1 ABC transporter ATP-binding protein [Saccharopolyspora erythraea]CAL99492.1 ABC transporter ATP-binding protein [Saccharopolyspora erythraea NRRL 2338]